MIRVSSIVGWSLATYVALSLVALAFEPLLFLWPYLFLLAIQEPLGTWADMPLALVLIAGALPVLGVASLVQRRLRLQQQGTAFDRFLIGGLVTILTLFGVTLVAFLAARIMGWPVGE